MKFWKSLFAVVAALFFAALCANGVEISISSYPWKFRTLDEMLSDLKRGDIRVITVFDGLKIGGKSEISESKFGWKMDGRERAALKKILSDNGVRVFSYSNFRTGNPTEIDGIFRFAKEMGIELVSIEASPDMMPRYDAAAEKYGVRAGIYNHGNDKATYRLPESAIAVLEKNPHLEMLPDGGQWGRARLDLTEMLKKSAGRFGAINAQDINENNGCMIYGTGILALDPFFEELFRTQKFDGTVIVMFDVADDPMLRILPSVKYLREKISQYSKR